MYSEAALDLPPALSGGFAVSLAVVTVTAWPGGRIETTFSTPWTYLNVYSDSSSASRLSSSRRSADGVPVEIPQFGPRPQRLNTAVVPPSADSVPSFGLRSAT